MRAAERPDEVPDQPEEEDADQLTGTGKEIKKLVRKSDKEGLYESDEDDNPYGSVSSQRDLELASSRLLLTLLRARRTGLGRRLGRHGLRHFRRPRTVRLSTNDAAPRLAVRHAPLRLRLARTEPRRLAFVRICLPRQARDVAGPVRVVEQQAEARPRVDDRRRRLRFGRRRLEAA